jgi:hypothetical protein
MAFFFRRVAPLVRSVGRAGGSFCTKEAGLRTDESCSVRLFDEKGKVACVE